MDESTGYSVLVINDGPEWEWLIKLILGRERGDQVFFALDGEQGLIMAEQSSPDLIILDIMMSGLDGWQVYQRLRQSPLLQQVPILFQSAIASEQVYPRAKHIGAAGYLEEPYRPAQLLAARDAALQGKFYYPPLEQASLDSERQEE